MIPKLVFENAILQERYDKERERVIEYAQPLEAKLDDRIAILEKMGNAYAYELALEYKAMKYYVNEYHDLMELITAYAKEVQEKGFYRLEAKLEMIIENMKGFETGNKSDNQASASDSLPIDVKERVRVATVIAKRDFVCEFCEQHFDSWGKVSAHRYWQHIRKKGKVVASSEEKPLDALEETGEQK
jgi:hypothetical protein